MAYSHTKLYRPALNKLRDVRQTRGLSLGQVAEAAGIAKCTLCNIEAGRVAPSQEVLERLAAVLWIKISLNLEILECPS